MYVCDYVLLYTAKTRNSPYISTITLHNNYMLGNIVLHINDMQCQPLSSLTLSALVAVSTVDPSLSIVALAALH